MKGKGDIQFSVVLGSVLVRAWREIREPGTRAWQGLAGAALREGSGWLISDMRLVVATASFAVQGGQWC